MKTYKATMQYSTEQVMRAEEVLSSTFGAARTATLAAVGIALSFYGGFLKQGLTGKLCLFLGVLLILFPFLANRRRKQKSAATLSGERLSVRYEFRPDHYTLFSGEDSMLGEYKKIIRLLEDETYLYLCLSSTRLLMLEKASVTPDSSEELKSFLAKQTGLKWNAPGMAVPWKSAH